MMIEKDYMTIIKYETRLKLYFLLLLGPKSDMLRFGVLNVYILVINNYYTNLMLTIFQSQLQEDLDNKV